MRCFGKEGGLEGSSSKSKPCHLSTSPGSGRPTPLSTNLLARLQRTLRSPASRGPCEQHPTPRPGRQFNSGCGGRRLLVQGTPTGTASATMRALSANRGMPCCLLPRWLGSKLSSRAACHCCRRRSGCWRLGLSSTMKRRRTPSSDGTKLCAMPARIELKSGILLVMDTRMGRRTVAILARDTFFFM